MPQRPRLATGGLVYHTLNRGIGRMRLFKDEADYAAFERVLEETLARERDNQTCPGGPGRLPAPGSHRPVRAQLTHTVPLDTAWLPPAY
jgi:hypothetical protein